MADWLAVHASAGGTLSGNDTYGSATDDCFDATAGTGTGGTADTWDSDVGLTSSPSSLCGAFSSPAFVGLSAVTTTVGTPMSTVVSTVGYPTPALTALPPLPRGLTFVDNADGTGTIAGTAATGAAGVHTVNLRATSVVLRSKYIAQGTMTVQVDAGPSIRSLPTRNASARRSRI